MPISEILTIPYRHRYPLPDFQDGDDIRFPDALVAAILERFTTAGDTVFDPFAGLGTTFFVCDDKERIPYGVEADQRRCEWVKSRIGNTNTLVHGDSGDICTFGFPEIDFSITSPPYMPYWHKWNPLFGGNPEHDGYDNYLERMKEIYRRICQLMKRNAYIVVQADNLADEKILTLVWDLGKALSEVMTLEGEILVNWSENVENDCQFTQCLVFRNTRHPLHD